ncbi:putative nup53/35/40-type RNA recognition motif containing protein [Lyophyllum shimeji]|uniref:Nup53/35/40-type RNA recognition motif containing protein n=1 Tax=Lyophyllum shimeji TaxID=47721 RepID=A0A9P3USQ6_LYOSH|nr:putative nup53/35/40-type RNA recognition motif containing protein [Lyophyllum shimeji]
MHSSPFTVAGMSSSTSAHHHHPPNANPWGTTSTGGQLTTSFSDSLAQSRSHYQPGYLMSSQTSTSPQGTQRVDEVPIVPTKAKMNQILSRGGTAADFGMDSMFESTRQRQKLADEDAPPTSSVNDIPNEFPQSATARYEPRRSTRSVPLRDGAGSTAAWLVRQQVIQPVTTELPSFARRSQRPAPVTPQQTGQPIYIVVFGYPQDRYSATVEYFQSLGATTDPDPHFDIQNCFRIGFLEPGDALRAVRKNGEVLGGTWMVGTKWADPLQAEALFGLPSTLPGVTAGPITDACPSAGAGSAMAVDETSPQRGAKGPQSKIGTPIRLAPSSAAFRKHTPAEANVATPQAQAQRGWGMPQPQPPPHAPQVPTSSPSKGMLGQVSNLIFGW